MRTAASLPDVDVVLLSPGAASYDLFANYEAKAAAFCELIDGLSGAVGGRALTWNPCPIQRRTDQRPGQSPSSPASTGSAIRTAASSTSARPRVFAAG